MKTRLCLILALFMVLLPAAAFAEAEYETYACEGVFTIEYPSKWVSEDEAFVSDTETDTHYWVVSLYDDVDDGVWVDIWMEKLSDYSDFTDLFAENFSLFKASDDEREKYVEYMTNALSNLNAEHVNTVYADEASTRVPFEVFVVDDEGAPYLYASTVAAGWEIYMSCYRADDTEMTQEEVDAVYELIASFKPVVE